MFSTLLLVTFLFFIAIQCAYWIAYIVGLSRITLDNPEHTEPVSIVIATRNDLHGLQLLLPKLYAQQFEPFEIVVINDRSTDGTYDFLSAEEKRQSNLNVVTVETTPDHLNPKKYALTLGIKAAQNDLLVFTDADCVPTSDQWLASVAAKAEGKEIVLGVSGYQSRKGLLNYFIRFETILTAIQYISLAFLGHPYMGVGRNLAYRKSLFLRHKGFNGYMGVTGGDDDLFINKHATSKNTAVAVNKESLVISAPKNTWSSFFIQKLRHLSVGKHYNSSTKLILAPFSLSYIFSWLLLPILLFWGIELYIVISSFFIRTLLAYITFMMGSKRLNVAFSSWGLVILELIFVLYYIFTGIAAVFTKRVRWS